MSKKDDGGHAFPPEPGMSLRDWFAGRALSGNWTDFEWGSSQVRADDVPEMARLAYAIADAMLEARKQ